MREIAWLEKPQLIFIFPYMPVTIRGKNLYGKFKVQFPASQQICPSNWIAFCWVLFLVTILNLLGIWRLSLFLFIYLAVTTLTWPAGKYGLPKAKVGCPLSTNSEWVTGWRFEDTEDENPRNIKSPSFHLDAIVGADINRTFCIKKNDINKSPVEWPQG